jgi:Tetratricopeptide repeat
MREQCVDQSDSYARYRIPITGCAGVTGYPATPLGRAGPGSGPPAGLAQALDSPAGPLMIGASVYREPADHYALLFQVGRHDWAAAWAPGRPDPAPPYQAPPDLAALIAGCATKGLLTVCGGGADLGSVFVERPVADELARLLQAANRAGDLAAAHERAAAYWRWRTVARQQERRADLHDLLEARHHLRQAGQTAQACELTEALCSLLHAWGELGREAALIADTLAWLPEDSGQRAAWVRELGTIAQVRADYNEAERRYQQALDIYAAAGDLTGVSRCHHSLGVLAQAQGEYARAEARYQQSAAATAQAAHSAAAPAPRPPAAAPAPRSPAAAPAPRSPAAAPAPRSPGAPAPRSSPAAPEPRALTDPPPPLADRAERSPAAPEPRAPADPPPPVADQASSPPSDPVPPVAVPAQRRPAADADPAPRPPGAGPDAASAVPAPRAPAGATTPPAPGAAGPGPASPSPPPGAEPGLSARALRWRLAGPVGLALAMFALSIAEATGVGGPAGRGHSPAPTARAVAAVRRQAAAWVAAQITRSAIVACDPVMCSAIRARGFPAGDLLLLGRRAADPLGSDVVVATAALRSRFGSRLAGVYAPLVLATFGAGRAAIEVRAVAPDGVAAFRDALAADLAARRLAGTQLLGNPGISAPGAVGRELADGAVDSRLLITLAALAGLRWAAQPPVRVISFGGSGPGASAQVPARSMVITGPAAPSVIAFLRAQRPPYLAADISMVRLPGAPAAVRIGFSSPSPLGLLTVFFSTTGPLPPP